MPALKRKHQWLVISMQTKLFDGPVLSICEKPEWIRSNRLDEMLDKYQWPGAVVVIDTETTGLNPYGKETHEPWEDPSPDDMLQLSIIDARTGATMYDQYFWPPHKSEWPAAEAVNKISPAMVEHSPSFYECRESVQDLLDAARGIIGYNVSFDLGFLEAAGCNYSRTKYLIDVMDDFAAHTHEKPEWAEDYTWQKLTYAAKQTGYTWPGDAHNSLQDCLATLHVAKWLQANPTEMLKWALWY